MLSEVELICKADGLPMPATEYRFAPPRRWRFDFCWISYSIALEVEGGIFMQGGSRHTRGKGYLVDLEKYNHAAALGWAVYRCTPQTIHLGMQFVKAALQR